MPHIFKGALNVILILCRPEKTYELIDIKIQTLLEKRGKLSESARTFHSLHHTIPSYRKLHWAKEQ